MRKLANTIGSWIQVIIVAVILSFLIIYFIGEKTLVKGSSMEPTLENQDQVVLDKISYRFRDPKRYEIVVFPVEAHDNKGRTDYVKRIIGLPGETVEIKNDIVYVNGKEISKDYSKDHMTRSAQLTKPITLGKDEYFVLGDNRNVSEDSRYNIVGKVKREKIKGRILFRVYPFDSFGQIK